jgi:uncharacterized protein involved in exopolysaccharide biosynthesis
MANQNGSQTEAFIIKDFISRASSFRYFYIACLALCLALAFIINKFSPTVYEINSIIGPVDDKRSSLLGSNDLFSGLGGFNQDRNLENDVNSLNSFSLVSSTLNKLNLEVGYFREKNIIFKQAQQIYPNSPYTVSIDKSHIQPIDAKFYIEILDRNSFRLTSTVDEATLHNYVDNIIVS